MAARDQWGRGRKRTCLFNQRLLGIGDHGPLWRPFSFERPAVFYQYLPSQVGVASTCVPPSFHSGWCPMLRLLGFVFLVLICINTAPWGLAIGAILCVAWLVATPASLTISSERAGCVADAHHRSPGTIPLVHAVYCADCDAITESDRDACCTCGSRSILAVTRLWQHSFGHAAVRSAKYKISFTADVREIPAAGLREATSVIASLADLGGELKVFHIQVDSVEAIDTLPERQKIELVRPVARSANAGHRTQRRAS